MKMHPDPRCISYWNMGDIPPFAMMLVYRSVQCVIPRDFRRKTKKEMSKNVQTEIPCAQALHYQTDGLYFHLPHPTAKLLHQCLGLEKK